MEFFALGVDETALHEMQRRWLLHFNLPAVDQEATIWLMGSTTGIRQSEQARHTCHGVRSSRHGWQEECSGSTVEDSTANRVGGIEAESQTRRQNPHSPYKSFETAEALKADPTGSTKKFRA